MRHCLLIVAALATLAAAGCGGRLREGGAPADAAWPGRLQRLPAWGWGAPGLAINVPEGYEKGLRAEEDFLVHLLRRPPEAAPPHAATVGVYVGHHPRDAKTKAISQPGRIAGRDVTWYGLVGGVVMVFGVWRPSARSLVVHVFIWGTDKAEVESLMESAKSLRLDRGK